jgi:hypothetical protein
MSIKVLASGLKRVIQEWTDDAVRLYKSGNQAVDVGEAARATAGTSSTKERVLKDFDQLWSKYSESKSFTSFRNVADIDTYTDQRAVDVAIEAAMSSRETKRVTQIASRMGIEPEGFNTRLQEIFALQDDAERTVAFRNLKNDLSDKALEKKYTDYADQYEQIIMANSAGEDTFIKKARKNINDRIENMDTKPGAVSEKRMYLEELYKTNQVLGEAIRNGAEYTRTKGTLAAIAGKYLTDVNSKINNAYVKFAEMGELAASQNLKQLNDLVGYSRKMDGWGRATIGKAERALYELEDGGMKIRQYVEGKNVENMELIEGLQVDRALAEDLGMTAGEVRLANKINNLYRSAMKTKLEIDVGDFQFRNLFKNWNEVPEDRIIYPEYLGRSDFGHNFWHAKPSDEVAEKLKSEVAGYRAGLERNDYIGAQSKIYMARKEFGGLKGAYDRRKMPYEELQDYSYQFFNSIPYMQGKRALQQVKMSLSIPKNVKGKLDDKMRDILDIEQQWDGFFIKSKTGEQMSKVESFFNDLSNLSIPMALFNANLWTINGFLQPFMNAGPSRGFFNVAKNELLTAGKFAKSIHNAKKGWTAVLDDMFAYDVPGKATRKQKLKSHVMKQFRANNPEIYAIPTEDIMSYASRTIQDGPIRNRLKKLLQYSIYPFKTSDIVSRHVVLSSSMDLADSRLSKVFDQVRAGKLSKFEARTKLEKELHLREFNALQRESLANKLRTNNMAKYKKYEDWLEDNVDFIYEYADTSVKTHIFDYSKFGRQQISQELIKKSPILAKVFTFRSWPLYYTKLLKGQIDAFSSGDRTPLLKSAAAGFSVFALAANAATSDDEYVASYGRYMQGKIPILSPVSFVSGLMENPFGMLEPIAGLGVWAPTKGMIEFRNLISGKNPSKMSSLDFMEMSSWRRMKNTPIIYRGQQLSDLIKEISDE